MKDMIYIILMIIFYGLGIIVWITMLVSNRKQDKLTCEYWKENIKRIKLENAQLIKSIKEEK